MTRFSLKYGSLVAGILLAVFAGCHKGPQAGQVEDEARRAGRGFPSFPAANEDYFHDMDGGHSFDCGRNQRSKYVAGVDGWR